MSEPTDRTTALAAYHRDAVSVCTRCRLSETRTQVVVGDGALDAELMLVGEAPGYHEDRQGLPFVGQSGKLLTTLLEGVGLRREDVFIANVLKCRPPGNRDPAPAEISACEPHLFTQIRLIRPRIVCTLGNFATRLLSGRAEGISRVHGHELPIEVAGHRFLLYPLFHPAAALYTRAMLATLEADFARIPALLRGDPPSTPAVAPVAARPAPVSTASDLGPPPVAPTPVVAAVPAAEQLGLF